MTRQQFEQRAILLAERTLGIPPGWWGTYRDVHGPAGERARAVGYGSPDWVVSWRGTVMSRHDSRAGAIAKARRYAVTPQRVGR